MTAPAAPFPPGPPLTPADRDALQQAILDGYRTTSDLVRLLNNKWGVRLGDVLYLETNRSAIVYELVEWADSKGRARELLGLLWAHNPENPHLMAIGARLLGPLEPISARYDLVVRTDAAVPLVVNQANLEKIVTDRSILVDYAAFQARLAVIGAAICRVETPFGMGTGFLAGPDHVLTNHHVVAEAIAASVQGSRIICRFDYGNGLDGTSDGGAPTALQDGSDWLLAHSPHAQSDLTGEGEPGPDELDYALLRLATPLPRTPLLLDIKPPIVAPMDIAIVVQHPGGDPLKVAMGVVLDLPGSGMRYRYNTTTEGGTSGSPVFSASLEPIGLHHAADPGSRPRYNQAVPLWRVAQAIAGRLSPVAP